MTAVSHPVAIVTRTRDFGPGTIVERHASLSMALSRAFGREVWLLNEDGSLGEYIRPGARAADYPAWPGLLD